MATASKSKDKSKHNGKDDAKMDTRMEQGVQSNGLGKNNGSVDAEGPRERALKLDIGLENKNRLRSCEILNGVVANQGVLYVKTRNYHWNVTGIHFRDIHRFLEEQYNALNELQDETAERVRIMGGRPVGSMAQILKTATLKEETRDRLDVLTMLQSLLADHEQVIRELREAIDECDSKLEDAGNADFLTDLLKVHEKTAWMIRVMCE